MSKVRQLKSGIDLASQTEEFFYNIGDTLLECFNVDSRDIKVGKKIGKGNWTARKAEWQDLKVAVKKFNVNNTFHSVSLTPKEVNRMLSLRHPNVLKLLGSYLTTQKEQVLECTMIMELMDCDLEDYIGRGALSDDQVVYIIAEVARGMNHIHKKGCFHGDLKPKNILLRESIVTGFNVDAKIGDFGNSKFMGAGDINQIGGTTGYKAPEQFDSTLEFFPDKADVFGFGALCFKILTGKQPYKSHMNVQEDMKKIKRAAISQRNLPEDVVQIIWQCLNANPVLRPNFDDISRILDRALSAIWEKMAQSSPLSTCASLHLEECMSKGNQGHDHLESILHNMGLSKEYGVHFIPFKELLVIGLLGQGANAAIYKVKWKGILYAQKKILGTNVHDSSFQMVNSHLEETFFQTIPKLCHKNIVTFMGYSVTLDNEISIIMELLVMDLQRALALHTKEPPLDIRTRVMIMMQIAEGMQYMHNRDVIHRDLKAHNVLVSSLNTRKLVVKLIDFGCVSKEFTPKYAPPEILRNRIPSTIKDVDAKKANIYSFGILCQEILSKGALLESCDLRNYSKAILRGERPPIPIGTSIEMVDLINNCWNGNPQKRPNFFEVCERLSSILYYLSCLGQKNVERFAQRCCILQHCIDEVF